MASNHKVQFSVSLTPTVVNDADQSVSTTALDGEIRKSLGGSGVVGDIDGLTMLADGDEVLGWAAGVPTYLSSNGGTGVATIECTDANNIVFIKNTGYLYGDATTLSDKLTRSGNWTTNDAVEVTLTNVGGVTLATLYPGEAVVFPRAKSDAIFFVSSLAGSKNIAVEWAIVQDGT
tara:strand:- start:395 stop:922 length:528 start_codon:yes stop_codon:yes gene_type:complete